MANKFLTNVELDAGLVDINGNTGTSGQVLSSTGSGVDWITPSTGSVSGTGTTNYIPKWSNSSTLTNSGIVETSTLTTINNNSFEYDYSGTTYLNIDGTTGTFLLGQHSTTNRVYIHGIQNAIKFYVDNVKAGEFTDDQDFLVTNGNVGIGTASPTEKLEVAGAIKMSENSSYPLTIDHNLTTTTNEITTVGGLNIISGSNNSINFKDATTTNMSISGYSGDVIMGYNTGKVGIGTTSPTDKLTVQNGNIRLNSTSSYPAQGLYAYWNSSSPNMGGISWHSNPGFIGSEWSHYKQSSPYTLARIRLIGDASSGGMFVNLNNSDVFTIKTSSGNVGIGETNPAQKLHVIGNSEITGDIFLGRYIFHNDDTNTWLGFPLADTISFRTNGSDRMYINSSGNVGIGTNSPSEKLEVDGVVKATASTDAYKGYIKQNVISYAAEKQESSNYYFTSYNTTATVTSAQAYNRIVAAYSGRVKKVYIRHSGGSTPTATAVNFKKHTNGTTSSTVYAATVANTASANMTAYYEFADSDFTFNAGDLIGLLYQTTDAFGTASKTMGGVAVTITLEYNIT
jgi:hypothetical protein